MGYHDEKEALEDVTVEHVSMVVPRTATEETRMFLSSCDLVGRPFPYINRIFFYRIEESFEAVVGKLKTSLSHALEYFYPVAGRFCDDENGRMEIECSDAGVEFVVATSNVPFSDLEADDFQHKPIFWQLARRTDLMRSDYRDQPIMSIQVTRFGDDGISISFSSSHAVADAQSAYHFMTCWAEICRGVPLTLPPLHMRTALKLETLFPDGTHNTPKEIIGYKMEPEIKPYAGLVQKLFSFSAEDLQRLKARASKEGNGNFSTFESFCAHWWKALIRARKMTDDQLVFLLIPINCRKRFFSLPEAYFGNALDGAIITCTAGEICSAHLGSNAARIHNAIAGVTEESFGNHIKEAEQRYNTFPQMERTSLFNIFDSPRFPIYETDFGWGRACAVRAEGMRYEGEVQMVQGREGGVDFSVALYQDSMRRLQEDDEFGLLQHQQ